MNIFFSILGLIIFGSLSYLLKPINFTVRKIKGFLSILTMGSGFICIQNLRYNTDKIEILLDKLPNEVSELLAYTVVLLFIVIFLYILMPVKREGK